jgi:hypothetical protein
MGRVLESSVAATESVLMADNGSVAPSKLIERTSSKKVPHDVALFTTASQARLQGSGRSLRVFFFCVFCAFSRLLDSPLATLTADLSRPPKPLRPRALLLCRIHDSDGR